MRITLCGSARFEKEFKEYNKRLTLAGHVVYSLACYPSDFGGKNWYTEEQKKILDKVHKDKILNSDAIYIVAPGGYIGDSTKSEIEFARDNGKRIFSAYPFGMGFERTCPHDICSDPLNFRPCAMCYE